MVHTNGPPKGKVPGMPVVKPCQLNVFDRFRCLLLAQPCNKLAATSHQLQHQRRAAEWLNGQASLRPIPVSYMHPRSRLHPRPRYRGGPSRLGLDHSRSQPSTIAAPGPSIGSSPARRQRYIEKEANQCEVDSSTVHLLFASVASSPGANLVVHVLKQEASNGHVSFHRCTSS